MAPKRDLTPKQVSNGLSYVQKEAPFISRMKNKTQEKERAMQKFENYEDGQDDEDYDELDGAQVVELDAKGKEIHKDTGEKSESEEEKEKVIEPEQPAVDETGRILFRKRAKKDTSKRDLQAIIDAEKGEPVKKKKKKQQKVSLLSFEDNDD
ncbi:uncharacterized protein EV154DRAFT_500662 [Mucor mucedo]|uniref:uncharacterized protein n=1 Tax=Mucor mucedo TaxID=29922 RepID=UPI00222061E8|nr:uncharacterized protein EV154DRAFT_500662 [Mucor mucedo]KAI7893747.1 hypothetical protein EV154DRAFT_500662 [Mucor mucedo]